MLLKKILIVVTSHAQLGGTGLPTGFWLEELAVPYRAFVQAGAQVDFASPEGGAAPADPRSEKEPSAEVKAFLADADAQKKLRSTLKLSEVTGEYDAVFLAGGHGTMFDLPGSKLLARLLSQTYAKGHVVAAVCHGPAGLVAATKPNGEPLVRGKRVAGFSNEEEDAMELTRVMPFALETRLRELGGKYERGAMWQAYVVADGKLITGQNPASSAGVAAAVLDALR